MRQLNASSILIHSPPRSPGAAVTLSQERSVVGAVEDVQEWERERVVHLEPRVMAIVVYQRERGGGGCNENNKKCLFCYEYRYCACPFTSKITAGASFSCSRKSHQCFRQEQTGGTGVGSDSKV